MIIRELVTDDFENGYFETLENLRSVEGLTLERAAEILRETMYNPCYLFLVAEIDGEVVGTTTLLIEQKFIRAGGKVGHIEDVSTRQGWERKGIGRALIERAIEEAKKRGCHKVILDCAYHNIPFYIKCRFKKNEVCMRHDIS